MLWKRKKICVRSFLNHGYEPQSKLWEYFVASCEILYPPLRGIIRPANFRHFVSEVWVSLQLNNSNALRFWNCSFTNKGTILITLIVTMLIFSVLVVIMLSLTGTSIFSQLNTSSTTRATYIAKSGYNYLASYYKNAANNEAAKNQALENLNNVNFNLLNNNGSFILTVKPSYLRSQVTRTITNSPGVALSVKFPGAESYTIPSSAADKVMAVYTGPGTGTTGHGCIGCGYHRFYYTTVAGSANNYTLTLSGTDPPDGQPINLVPGTGIVPVLALANAQTLTRSINNSTVGFTVVTGTGAIFPARFGFFEIPLVDTSHVYSYDHRTGDIFYGIRDAQDPTRTFSYALTTTGTANTITGFIYAHTSAAITSTGTFNPGLGPAVSNTFSRTAILGYTPGGNSGAIPPLQDIPGIGGWIAFGGGASGPGIGLNTGTGVISIGQGLKDTAGVAWYAGNTDVADCTVGICTFGTGIRAYFEFADSNGTTSSGDGFMFMIMNGILNDTTKRGGTVSGAGMGELMGYAGPGNTTDQLGLQPPKLAIEFDRYQNTGVSTPAGCTNGRNDDAANHMALMFWGDNTAGNCATGSPIANLPAVSADDNVHSAGTAGSATIPQNSYIGTPSPVCATDPTQVVCGYYSTSFANTTTREFRLEVTRYVTPNGNGNYNYNVKAWIDCTACDDLSVPYSGASTVRINRTIELSPDLHTDFNKMVFGFTQGTGSATQNITINNFDIFFPGACNYSLNPTTRTVPRAAVNGSTIALSMSGSCSWTAVSDSAWLTIPSGASGAGSGTITYNYTLNGGTTRTGIITVTSPAGPQTFTLTQTNP
jgi:hypothetical protein